MKTLKIFGFHIVYYFNLYNVKKLTFDLPDWADDTHVTNENPSNEWKIKYYKCSTTYYIDLPKCKKATVLSLTPLTDVVDGKRTAMTNRKIVVEIYK